MVDINEYVDCDAKALGVKEQVYYPVLEKLIQENGDDRRLSMNLLSASNIAELIPKHITKEDIMASINYNMHLEYGIGNDDDIDHLGNRRIRAVGELLQNQYQNWFSQTGKSCP